MLIKTPLLHQSLGPRVFLSFCLSLSLSLYFWLIFWNAKASCVTQEILASLLFYFLIVDARPPGSGPLKDLSTTGGLAPYIDITLWENSSPNSLGKTGHPLSSLPPPKDSVSHNSTAFPRSL